MLEKAQVLRLRRAPPHPLQPPSQCSRGVAFDRFWHFGQGWGTGLGLKLAPTKAAELLHYSQLAALWPTLGQGVLYIYEMTYGQSSEALKPNIGIVVGATWPPHPIEPPSLSNFRRPLKGRRSTLTNPVIELILEVVVAGLPAIRTPYAQ